MQYKIKEYSLSAAVVNEVYRASKMRFSHLVIFGQGTAVTTDLAKISVNVKVSGIGGSDKNRITSVDLLTLARYCDITGGVSIISTTGYIIILPIGDISLDAGVDMVFEFIATSALANALSMNVYGVRMVDGLPHLDYERRNVGTDGVTFDHVMCLYDINTAIDSTVSTVLTFDNGSQATIFHKVSFALAQGLSQLETSNVFGLIFQDKDLDDGRTIQVRPSTAFDAFVVKYSDLNYK